MPSRFPRLCPNCGEPYIARTIPIRQARLVEHTEGPGWVDETYIADGPAVPMPEFHHPCSKVRMWTNATEDGTWT